MLPTHPGMIGAQEHSMSSPVKYHFLIIAVMVLLFSYGCSTPIGVVRRLLGNDSLRLRAFKAAGTSAMHERHQVFAPDDLDKPY